jgi:hypothetical protein
MCLWAIYIFPGSVHIHISSSRNGSSIVGIYNSLTDTWMWKLELRPRYSFSGNICFQFSAFFLCSAGKQLMKETPHVRTCRKIHLLARFIAADQSNALISTL